MSKTKIALALIIGAGIGEQVTLRRANQKIKSTHAKHKKALKKTYIDGYRDGLTIAATDPTMVKLAHYNLFGANTTDAIPHLMN